MFKARIARSRSIRLLTAQPITRRECRSRTTARYSQPSRVARQASEAPPRGRPDITDINNPFLVGPIRYKVAVQQVRRDIELVIAIRSHLVFARSDHRYTVLAHQSANTPMTDFQPQFFEFLCHPGPPIAAQRQAMLFSDMSQQHHILTLALADRTGPESAKAT